jgi:8-oxo-dGTP pyrophosphatase MutT (NUDIX family)
MSVRNTSVLSPTIDEIEAALAARPATIEALGPQTREAAVAIILRPGPGAPEVLFIKRAEKPGDPWSGHMAFPGGHREPEDGSMRVAAERETHEEVGIDLVRHGRYLGPIHQQRAAPRGRTLDMIIAPEVFLLERPAPTILNYEVEDVVWLRLDALLDNRWHDTETLAVANSPTVFNGYRLPDSGYFIWGLTYRMLKTFFWTLDPQWSPLDSE